VASQLKGLEPSTIEELRGRCIVHEIHAGGREALPVQADVANVAECSRLFDAAVNAFGGLDILVANAGVQRDAPSAE
jgi:glucose 1-dehydrogenase